MGFTAIARVTEDRWITCASLDHLSFGLQPGDELEVSSTICHEVRACRETVVIPDVDAERRLPRPPHPAPLRLQELRLGPDHPHRRQLLGHALRHRPRARAASARHVRSPSSSSRSSSPWSSTGRTSWRRGRAALASERDTARLREEFIAVVGHDLRNPIAAVSAGLSMLATRPSGEQAGAAHPGDAARDHARRARSSPTCWTSPAGVWASGSSWCHPGPVALEPTFRDVIAEIEKVAAQPIERDDRPAPSDPRRPPAAGAAPVEPARQCRDARQPGRRRSGSRPRDQDGMLRLAVTNQGAPIPEAVRPSLFLPFSRGGDRSQPAGPRPRALHRLRDRPGAWRPHRRPVGRGERHELRADDARAIRLSGRRRGRRHAITDADTETS